MEVLGAPLNVGKDLVPSEIEALNLSLAEKELKKMETSGSEFSTEYLDLRFLLPTLKMCERLSSKFGYSLNYRLKGIFPMPFES